jgi:hypothetical protein
MQVELGVQPVEAVTESVAPGGLAFGARHGRE